jgi:ADP-heptose:LPS heptosyltransferase
MILISPYAKKLRDKNGPNPKDYPYWDEVVAMLNGNPIVQVGIEGERRINGVTDFRKGLSFDQIRTMVEQCEVWISVDNFLPHLAHHVGKPGIVLWGQSDPNVFGYPENINLLKDRKYLRGDQFMIWEACEYNVDAFVGSQDVINAIRGV